MALTLPHTVTQIVKNNTACFVKLTDGIAYYRIYMSDKVGKITCLDCDGTGQDPNRMLEECGSCIGGKEDAFRRTQYTIQVPLVDIGTATLLARDKAIFLMRWIRQGIKDQTIQLSLI